MSTSCRASPRTLPEPAPKPGNADKFIELRGRRTAAGKEGDLLRIGDTTADLMQVVIARSVYYLNSFMDEYSRFIVHHELVLGMDGITVSLAAQAAIDTLPKDAQRKPTITPVIQSDNGSGYIAKEFRQVLGENGLGHHRIRPHCSEENGTMERLYRTVREHLGEVEFTSLHQAREVLSKMVAWYNGERLHSALAGSKTLRSASSSATPASAAPVSSTSPGSIPPSRLSLSN